MTQRRRRAQYSAMKSRKRKRLNVQLVQQEYRMYGGELPGLYPEMPCARIAGKFAVQAVVDDSADYRKYGVISFTKSEDSKKPDKIENRTKKQKVGCCPISRADISLAIPVPQRHRFLFHQNYRLALGAGRWSQRVPWPGVNPVLSPFIQVSLYNRTKADVSVLWHRPSRYGR